MSKYVYCKGKIYDIKNDNRIECIDNELYIYLGKAKYKLEIIKEFDNFEDLIEVGDIVRFKLPDGSLDLQEMEYQTHIALLVKSDKSELESIEIYKHIDNNFIRVCHKENGSWGID